MALDKFFCKVPETKVTDKQIEFHSEREANEYCRENDIDPHNVILMGDKYTIKTKDSGFRTTMDEAIRMCDGNKIALPEISDTWRLIDKYNIKYTTSNGKIYIDIDEAKSKGAKEDYIKRLSKMTRLYGRGDF